jgi:excisionase family DNA binding protein
MKRTDNNDKSAYITVSQLAEYCCVSKKTIYKLISNGELKCTRFGKSIRFSKVYIRRYLEEIENPKRDESKISAQMRNYEE